MPSRVSPGSLGSAPARLPVPGALPGSPPGPPPGPPPAGDGGAAFDLTDPFASRVSCRDGLTHAAPPPAGGWGEPEPDLCLEWYPNPAVLASQLRDRSVVELPFTPSGPPQRPDPRDRRLRLISTDRAPWRWVCSLTAVLEGGLRVSGTGWLFSPRTVVTAGHCLFLRRFGGWARWVEVFIGRDEGYRQSTHISNDLYSVLGWTVHENREYDYGVIRLPEPARVEGCFQCQPVDDEQLQELAHAHVAGYPGEVQPAGTLWGMRGKIAETLPREIRYQIISSHGQSGGPVFFRDGNDRVVIGIHAYGRDAANQATRITPDVYTNLLAWDALP